MSQAAAANLKLSRARPCRALVGFPWIAWTPHKSNYSNIASPVCGDPQIEEISCRSLQYEGHHTLGCRPGAASCQQQSNKAFAREALPATGWFSHSRHGTLKSTILAAEYQNTYISQNHTIYYTLAMFYYSPGYQNIDISVPQITPKSTEDINTSTYLHT